MRKLWALLFLSVPVWGVGSLVIAATVKRHGSTGGWWWPRALSTFGADIDNYFWGISLVTAFTFILTTGLLGWFMLKYTDETPGPADSTHHNTALEATWTGLTAVVLLLVAAPQVDDFERLKVGSKMPTQTVAAEVTGRQFEWRIRYPGADGTLRTLDDVWALNEFHLVQGVPTRIDLRSDDVLHSWFIPAMRIKQDAVPGSVIPVWFDANTPGVYDLVCAELCGWGHYKMRGRVVVHATQAEMDAWIAQQRSEQEAER